MKFLKQFIRNFILRSDMFAAQPSLRFNGQSSYQTVFGGCLSILLVASFAAIFGSSFINVINKVNVSASVNIEDNPYDSSELNEIRMAIGIQGLDFSSTQRYFNIILRVQTAPLQGMPSSVEIDMSPCQIDDWKDEGEHFQKLFQVYSMSKMLCPSVDQNLTLKGFAGSPQWVTMSVMIQQCRNGTSTEWDCYSSVDINTKFNNQLTASDFFKVNFLVLNNVISPQQEDPVKTVLQNQIFVTFSNTSGSRCQLKLGKYSISTDNSIWPFSSDTSVQGYYITSHDTYSINLYSTHYVRIEIEKARTIYQVTRAHDKLDTVLSYVGGLFALLFGWIYFFIGSYNQYKYEIAVAQHAFALDQTGRKIKEDQFGFWTYLKYSVFDWLTSFRIPLCWTRMEQINSAREQATEQMDIRYLMKKIQRFETINKFLLGEHNLIYANLCRPPTLDQVKRLRKITQYYDKVIKVQNEQNILMNILKVSNDQNKITNADNLQLDQKHQGQAVKQQELSLDSQDEQIQRQIANMYKKAINSQQNGELSARILEEIPNSMKHRLLNLSNSAKQGQGEQSKCKIKIQSTFTLNDSTPIPFFKGLIGVNNNK